MQVQASLFEQLAKENPRINLYIYTSRTNEHTEKYREFAEKHPQIHFIGHKDAVDLYNEIPMYDFGLACFNTEKEVEHLDTVLSNKLIEYISCGIPPISFPHKAQKKFIETHNVGFVVENFSDLEKILTSKKAEEAKESVISKRNLFTVERNIHRVYNFYNLVLDRKPMS